MLRIEAYEAGRQAEWDGFVRNSKNGTFILERDYMEYHRARFQDHSLMVLDDGALLAVMPAHAREDLFASHGGLTFGGFVTDVRMKTPRMLEMFDLTLGYLKGQGFRRMLYKTIPHIYTRVPAEEDRYALFLADARVVRRGVLTVVDASHRVEFQERRSRGAKKARQLGITMRRSDDFEQYWTILTERLLATYGARPVHELGEIRQLAGRFPENIRLFACFEGPAMVAGVVVFESERTARVQYIAANDRGRTLQALDLLCSELLLEEYRDKPFVEFGTSDEQDGRVLNRGLIDQKEGFGARAVAHDHYEVDLSRWVEGTIVAAMA